MLELIGYTSILYKWKEYIFHRVCSWSVRSVLGSGSRMEKKRQSTASSLLNTSESLWWKKVQMKKNPMMIKQFFRKCIIREPNLGKPAEQSGRWVSSPGSSGWKTWLGNKGWASRKANGKGGEEGSKKHYRTKDGTRQTKNRWRRRVESSAASTVWSRVGVLCSTAVVLAVAKVISHLARYKSTDGWRTGPWGTFKGYRTTRRREWWTRLKWPLPQISSGTLTGPTRKKINGRGRGKQWITCGLSTALTCQR